MHSPLETRLVLLIHELVCELDLPSSPNILELYNAKVAQAKAEDNLTSREHAGEERFVGWKGSSTIIDPVEPVDTEITRSARRMKREARLAAKKADAERPTVSVTWWACKACHVVAGVPVVDLAEVGTPHCPNCEETEMTRSSYSRGIEEAEYVCPQCTFRGCVRRTNIEVGRTCPRNQCDEVLMDLTSLGGRPIE